MATLDSSRQVYWLEGAGLVTNSNADLSNSHALSTPTFAGLLNLAIDPAADIVLWTGYSTPGIQRARLILTQTTVNSRAILGHRQ